MDFDFFGRGFHFLSDDNQQEKAIAMLEKYIFKSEILVVLAILLIYFLILMIAKIRKKEKLLNNIRKISPWMYLFVILGITILNRTPGDREIRLVFDNWFTQNGFHESNVLGFMFNLTLYIPFGYLLHKYGKAVAAVIIICTSSLLIEALQYIFARGVTAMDDLLANIIGGLIGLGLAMLFNKVKKQKRESVE